MNPYHVSKIRWPDEFRYALNGIANNFDKYVEVTDDLRTITLKGLSPQQTIAYSIFMLASEVDEVIQNLNMTMSDMERLGKNSSSFYDRNPFNRFQFLVRMYFYEYGRFEDVFGYFTKWKQERGLMTKDERKAHRQAFYDCFEYAIKTRNVMLHDGVSWGEQCSPEIAILQCLEKIGHVAIDSAGKQLSWDEHIGLLCDRTLPVMLAMGQHMQVFWNMELAHVALSLIEGGQLQKAARPYVGPHAAMFLKVDPTYR